LFFIVPVFVKRMLSGVKYAPILRFKQALYQKSSAFRR
jgi:hypothetical protein